MKKINILALIFGSVLLTVSCEQNTTTTDPPVPTPIAPIEELEIVEVPSIIIPVTEADAWFKNYSTQRVELIENAVNEKNKNLSDPYLTTRFVTINYSDLRDYLNFVDQESKDAGITPEGLRFYFGVTKPTGKKLGKETVYVNPVTSFKNMEGDISYAIATGPSGKKQAVTVGSVIDNTKSPSSSNNLILQNGSIQSLAGDSVTWPPPPVPGDPNDYH